MDGLVGKTIAAVVGDEFDGDRVLVFTDGTRAVLRPAGYEVDGVQIELLGAGAWINRVHEQALSEDARRDAAAVAREMRAEEDRMREQLDEESFVQWKNDHRPGWRWTEALQREMESARMYQLGAINRQVYGGAPDER